MPAALPPARQRLHDLMTATLSDQAARHDWTYEAVRPLQVPPSWKPGQNVVGDCSKGVQYLCRWAGAPDPMGNNFGPYGNSQTMWAHLPHLAQPSDLDVGDLVAFGLDGQDHVAMVLEPGPDPLLWSFGHQGAPNDYRLSQDGRPATFLRLPVADPPPTGDELLRAHTGFYAWVAWRLGEGPWRDRPPRDRTVRPNVPALIPAGWWVRLARFLANRGHGNQATR